VISSASADAALSKDSRPAVMDWARDNPVYAVGLLAIVILVFYFAYVFLVINYPGLFSRSTFLSSPPPAQSPAVANTPPPVPVAKPEPAPSAPMPTLDLPAQNAPSPDQNVSQNTAPVTAPQPAPAAETRDAPLQLKPAAQLTPEVVTPPARTPRPEPAARPPRSERASSPPRSKIAPLTNAAASAQPPSAPVSGVQVRATDAGNRIGMQLDEAYSALQSGDVPKARSIYADVLARDDRNIDALLGAGAASWRAGDTNKASDYYYRVLELDPQNAAAQAGLIGMIGRVDPIASESRLKQLIAREPSGFLYAALGHVHADQGQWSAAQQAYFQALQSEPANPDYAYNLAVGLERVGQPKIAATYYRQAVELARTKGHAGFDRKLAIQRIERLGGTVE
jgi:Tfp pilus assembly protein PilF